MCPIATPGRFPGRQKAGAMRIARLVLLILLSLPATLFAEDFSDLYEKLSPSVVTIHTSNFDSQKQASQNGLGSGVVIEPDKILSLIHI